MSDRDAPHDAPRPPSPAPVARRRGKRGRPAAPLGDGVIGVYDRSDGLTEIRYVQGGRKKSAYRRKRETAEKWAGKKHAELVSGAPAAIAEAIDEADAKRRDWTATLDHYRARVLADPTIDPIDALKALAAGASAAAKLIDAEARLRRIDKLEELVKREQGRKQ